MELAIGWKVVNSATFPFQILEVTLAFVRIDSIKKQ